MTKKGTVVDPYSTLSDCRLLDLGNGRGSFGKILRLDADGISVFTNFEVKVGAILRVTFYDEVAGHVIVVFVRVRGRLLGIGNCLNYFQLRRAQNATHFYGTSKPREYYGRICNLKVLPEEYHALIKRIEKTTARPNQVVVSRTTPSSCAIEFKIAETAAEKESAWRLAYAEAVRRTGAPHSDKQLLVSKHLLLPSTTTIVGIRSSEVVVTLTCTGDTAFGLPIDEAHRIATARLRGKSAGLVEFGLCGVREDAFGGFEPFATMRRTAALKDIFKFAVRHAMLARGASHAVATSGMFDKKIWKRFGFVELQPFSNRPWAALQKVVVLDLKKAAAGFAVGKVDERRLSAWNVFTMRDLYYLFVEQSNLASRLTREERELLAKLHPLLNEWFTSLPTLLLYT